MLSAGYTEASISNNDVGSSGVLNFCQPACNRELGTDEKFEHVDSFLRTFVPLNSHRENLSLSRKLVLLLQEMM